MTKFLYDFHWNRGRMGDVTGRFLATPEEVNVCIGKEINFGEILGKHSDVGGILEEKDIKLVTSDLTFISMAETLGIDLSSGYNPLDYLLENL